MKIGLTLNWKAKWHKPLLSPESWQALPQGEAYCNVLTHYFTQWTPKILGYQILKVGALSGEIAFDLPLRHQIVLAEKTAYFSTALLNESDSLLQASPLALPFIEKEMDACLLANTLNFAHDPHQILREAHRVLKDDGWIFITLFNPMSPLLFKPKLGDFKFRQYATWRVIDWLSLLNFDVIAEERLSIKQEKTTLCSPLTVIVAQKRTYPLTLNPEKARSKMPAFLEPAGAFKEIRTE